MKGLVPFALSCLSTSPPSSTDKATSLLQNRNRRFEFVEYGSSIPEEENDNNNNKKKNPEEERRPTICCDGRIAGVTLELTHWNGNTTPDQYYADTSTEMALRLPTELYPNARIFNNHYDTDGVLSVFACLQPELAQHYASLLIEGAAAGDFGEWTSDRGIQLDAIVEGMLFANNDDDNEEDEALAYQTALQRLPDILHDLTHNQGRNYESMWKLELDHAYHSLELLLQQQRQNEKSNNSSSDDNEEDDGVTLEQIPSLPELVLCIEPANTRTKQPASWLSNYALHRALVEKGWWDRTNRILRVQPQRREGASSSSSSSSSSLYHYRYEKPGHGWVQKVSTRRPIPPVPTDLQTKLVEALEEQYHQQLQRQQQPANDNHHQNCWKKGGPSLVTICSTTTPIPVSPHQVIQLLHEMDHSCTAAAGS